jgi:glyoxalase family protein
MSLPIRGLHHVTAVASDVERNLDFYVRILGLRLLKRTVHFADPDTYHLYYGDAAGRPGTILTFFVRAGGDRADLRRPRPFLAAIARSATAAGPAQATAVAFEVPAGAFAWWAERLTRYGVAFSGPSTVFGEEGMTFWDHDGLELHLVGVRRPRSAVRGPQDILGFHGVRLSVASCSPTCEFLSSALGFAALRSGDDGYRFAAAGPGPGRFVDIVTYAGAGRDWLEPGTVHHVAFRSVGAGDQRSWRRRLVSAGIDVTEVMDRKYFQSVYFEEPCGVRLEIATDGPGFTIDESFEQLGSRLQLPAWLEPQRAGIEARLPPFHVPIA